MFDLFLPLQPLCCCSSRRAAAYGALGVVGKGGGDMLSLLVWVQMRSLEDVQGEERCRSRLTVGVNMGRTVRVSTVEERITCMIVLLRCTTLNVLQCLQSQ